jgi:hypothetical protein
MARSQMMLCRAAVAQSVGSSMSEFDEEERILSGLGRKKLSRK